MVTLAVALIAGLGLIWQRATARLAKEPAMATAVFADGFRVEIIRCLLVPKLEHRLKVPFRLFKTGSGMSWAHGGMHLATREEGGQLVQASIEHQTKRPCLMVLLRASWPDGTAYTSETFVMDEGQQMLQIERDGTRAVGLGTAPAGPGSVLDACGLLMDVEDGLGGWLSVAGPVFADTKDAHALAFCPGFPRTSPSLRLRFQRPGQAPVEVQVPNPGHRPTLAVLKPEPLPIVRDSSRYRVELQRLKLMKGAPPGRLVFQPEFKVEAKGAWNTLQLVTDTLVDDAQGNSVLYSSAYIGHILLPGQRVVYLRHVLKPSAETYPWLASDGTFIAEGTWDASGKVDKSQISEEGRRLGFAEIQITPAKPSPGSRSTPVLDVKIEGKGDEALWRRVQGLSPGLSLVLFDASGNIVGKFGGTSRSFRSLGPSLGPRYSWTGRSTWSGTPGSGTTFRLAIVPEPPTEEHEFVVELPATTTP